MTPQNVQCSGFCACGCGGRTRIAPQTHKRKGWLKGRPVRFLSGHNATGRRSLGLQRYEVDHVSGCWNWLGAIDAKSKRACCVSVGGVGARAYRRVYEAHRGTIPEGLQLDHLCRNPRCVNPDHLEPVTGAENTRRAIHSDAWINRWNGRVFGKLTVLRRDSRPGSALICRCACGAETVVLVGNLTSGKTRSCGSAPCKREWRL
jgi:hypothetical protein